MKISTKGRYALRILIDLAQHRDDDFIALNTIAERQDISKKYLEQIVPILNRSGIILTNRGYKGGYKLCKDPSAITVGEVLRLTEGNLFPVACFSLDGTINCDRRDVCLTLPIWKGLEKVIDDYLDGISIQDVLDRGPLQAADNYII